MEKMKSIILVLVVMVSVVFGVSLAMAEEFNVAGRPLNMYGYLTQGGAFSLIDNDKYDTQKGLQAFLMNLLIEGDYAITRNLKFAASGRLSVDWAYQLNANRASWHDKLFSNSKHLLNVDDRYWQLLNELHVTWTPGNFLFRVGKQIVVWGETDGFRLMDQINPLDQRRGFADVEFENTIIPIWLIRSEYFPPIKSTWLTDLGFEFIFNPNPDFIPNQSIRLGNNEGGIWAPNVEISGPFPTGVARVGSAYDIIREPRNWNSEGYEYGVRIKGVIASNTNFTLNYFYGRENDPVLVSPLAPSVSVASDGKLLIHPTFIGKFPRLHYTGATVSREIPVSVGFLGGVSPVMRLEGLYAFDSTFSTTLNTLEKHDEIRCAIGLDWKVKIPLLNPTSYFNIGPQFYYRKVLNYPDRSEYFLYPASYPPNDSAVNRSDNFLTTLFLSTSYLHNKLSPSFFWMHDINNNANMYRLQLTYDYSDHWHFTLGALLLDGNKNFTDNDRAKGFGVFQNKDFFFFKVGYKWG
jgi:hypothetical protein